MENEEETIIECWVEKFCANKKISIGSIGKWQRRYVVLKRIKRTAYLYYFTHRPKESHENPKGRIVLDSFSVRKFSSLHGHKHVCVLASRSEILTLSFECENIFHLFVFFLQTQMQLKEDVVGNCFKVRPDNSVEQCKIGARGNMCILCVNKGGLILALELSRCILALWPLHCIKSFEATGFGSFSVEVGKYSPSGGGLYVFKTRAGEDDHIYSSLDSYVNDAIAQKQHQKDHEIYKNDLKMGINYISDDRFINQLKRISRDIYDHLWQLGDTSRRPSTVSSASTCETLKRSALVRNRSSPTILELVPGNQISNDQAILNLSSSAHVLPGHKYYNESSLENQMTIKHHDRFMHELTAHSNYDQIHHQKKWPYVEVKSNSENSRESALYSESAYEYMKSNSETPSGHNVKSDKISNSSANHNDIVYNGYHEHSDYNYIDIDSDQVSSSYSYSPTKEESFNHFSSKDRAIVGKSSHFINPYATSSQARIRKSVSNPDFLSMQFDYGFFNNKPYGSAGLQTMQTRADSGVSVNTPNLDVCSRFSSFSNSSSTAPLLQSPVSLVSIDLPGISRTPESVTYRKFIPPISCITSSSV